MTATLKPCGTDAAYRRHRKNGETPCAECRAARANHEAKQRPPRLRARGVLGRFWAKVALPDANGCMLWMAGKDPNGYGRVTVNGKYGLAHRVALIQAEGPPPDSERVIAAHAPIICHRPDCVAPAHLRWATYAENSADMCIDGTSILGTRSPRAKLTEASVASIRQRYAAGGITQQALASEFSVSRATMRNAIIGVTWPHVGGAS